MIKLSSNLLQSLGLTESQGKVYLAALELGEASMQDLARKSGVKRSTIYHFIDHLKDRRLVAETKKGKRIRYSAVHPERLMEMERARLADLQKVLPELQAIHNGSLRKPRVTFHEGPGGIKELYAEILKDRQPLIAWGGDMRRILPLLGDFFTEFGPERARRNIPFRWIMADTPEGRKFTERNYGLLREVKYIRKDLRTEVNIFGNKVGIISYHANPSFAVLIEDQDIATTLREAWEALWERLPGV